MASSKIALDLSKFKHVRSDAKSTTLRHADGHELRLAHDGLSDDHKQQLEKLSNSEPPRKKMADGGSMADQEPGYGAEEKKDDNSSSSPSEKPSSGNLNYSMPEAPKPDNAGYIPEGNNAAAMRGAQRGAQEAEGGMIHRKMYANAGPVLPSEDPNIPDDPNDPAFAPHALPEPENTEIPEDMFLPSAEAPTAAMSAIREAAPKETVSNWANDSTPQPQSQEGKEQQPAPSSSSAALDTALPENMMTQGFGQQVSGIEAQAKAQAALGKAQASVLQQKIKDQTDANIAFNQQIQALNGERQAHIQDIQNNLIDPQKYWTGDPSTGAGGHSKLLAGIGMIIGGFNPTNNPNAAINMLKYQMDQNLEAQKTNLGAKQNLLMANLRQFGNIRDATDMTRLMIHDITSNELAKAAANNASPMAQAAKQQAIGKLQMDAAPIFQNFAMRRAMMNLAGGAGSPGAVDQMLGYMRVMNPEMAKEMESRYVPGVGMGSVPIPEAVRSKLIAHQNVNRMMNEVQNFAQQHGGTVYGKLSPSIQAQGQTLMNQLQSAVRQAESQGVYKESEAEFMNKTLGDNPANFFANYTTVPKIKELQHQKQAEYEAIASGYGLHAQQLQGPPKYKVSNGVKYMRGPQGQAIPVR